jgi:hypothetical protein
MKLKQSDINHLRRLLGYVRCEIGQSPDEMVATVRSILPAIGAPSEEGKQRLVESHQKAVKVPAYIRAAVRALGKAILLSERTTIDGDSRNAMPRVSRICTVALGGIKEKEHE